MKSNIILIIASIFLISLIVTLNQLFQQNYQAEMVGQFSQQQLLLAQTVSKDIKRSIEHLKDTETFLARLLGNTSLHRKDLDSVISNVFTRTEADVEFDLRVFDDRDVLRYSSLKHPASDKDRTFIEKAKELKAEEILLLYRAEEQEVSLITPVFDINRHKGTLVVNISIDSITREFISPIKSGQRGYAWMMDDRGTLLYHPAKKMIGGNLYRATTACFLCHESFGVEIKILESGPTGVVQSYVEPIGEDKIIAFSRIELSPASFWIACMSIPYSEVTASVRKSIKLHSMLVIAVFFATAAAAFTLLVINKKRIRAEESARHKAELEQYAAELERAVERRTVELISEKDKLDAIVSTLDVGIFLADSDKNVIWFNKTLKEWLGENNDKILTLDDIYGGAELSSTVDDKMIQEVVHHTLGKRTGYFQITSSLLVGPDGNMQLLGLIHDVTEVKKFEEQMAHSEKLASLGRLTAGIAHEIGNPLTSVFSFLQILREMEDDNFKKGRLDTILFHITRIADIVRQLSGLSKPLPSEFKEVQVNDVIESSLVLLQYDKRAKPISVNKELARLPSIVADGNQLSQVFVNLILNAVDAMPDGGTLTITSRDAEENIKVDVKDTGIGISAENLKRVFDPFFTTKDKGTGLGLSVSYGIMLRLGGDISVKSDKGKGTTFTVTIPKDSHKNARVQEHV